MSPIQHELLTRHKNKKLIQNLQDQITPLYNHVQSAFMDYSKRLTAKENKFVSMIGDFWKKNTQAESFKEKDNYLTGIEVVNYTKEAQIEFTFRYYNNALRKEV